MGLLLSMHLSDRVYTFYSIAGTYIRVCMYAMIHSKVCRAVLFPPDQTTLIKTPLH